MTQPIPEDARQGAEIQFCAACGALVPEFPHHLDPLLRRCRCGCREALRFVGQRIAADRLRETLAANEPEVPHYATVSIATLPFRHKRRAAK